MAVTGYKLKVNGGVLVDHIIDVGNVLTYDETGLASDTEYTAEYAAYDGAGNLSGWSPVSDPVTTPFEAKAFVASASVGGITGGTTGAIDTTGATLLVISICGANDVGHGPIVAGDVSDSKGNTWIALTNYEPTGFHHYGRLFYAANPTVGTGHTFTIDTDPTGSYLAFAVAAFSGVAAISPFDVENGLGLDSVTTIQPGSITPSVDNELVVSGFAYGDGTTTLASVDSGMTIAENYIATVFGSPSAGIALAYKIQTTAAAINPTWDSNGASQELTAEIASFK